MLNKLDNPMNAPFKTRDLATIFKKASEIQAYTSSSLRKDNAYRVCAVSREFV